MPTTCGVPKQSPIEVLSAPLRCLTSVSGRELVDPAWYGRWRDAGLRVLHLVWSGAFKIPDEVKKKWSAKCVCNT